MTTITDTVSVTITCKNCGGHVLELPDDYSEDSIAKCKSCGIEVGRYGDIRAKAKEVVAAKVKEDFRNIFKGMKGWTFQ